MWFWVFMFVCDLLIPIFMTVVGMAYVKGKYPKKINNLYGYRTDLSRKNQDSWEFAQKLFGKLSYICGLIMLPLSVLPFLFVIGSDIDKISTVGVIEAMVQLAVLILIIPVVEKGIRKEFGK